MKLGNGTLAAVIGASWLALAGCEEQGPLERAGEEVDEAVEDVGNGGETFGNRVDDAVDDVRAGAADAADEIREGAEDVADNVRDATN